MDKTDGCCIESEHEDYGSQSKMDEPASDWLIMEWFSYMLVESPVVTNASSALVVTDVGKIIPIPSFESPPLFGDEHDGSPDVPDSPEAP